MQQERDDLYSRFTKAIHEVQQKTGFKNLVLEKKLTALTDTLEKKASHYEFTRNCTTIVVANIPQEAQLNEVLAAANLDPSALAMVTKKLEVYTNITTQEPDNLYMLALNYPQSHCRMYWTPKTVLSETYSMSWPEFARLG